MDLQIQETPIKIILAFFIEVRKKLETHIEPQRFREGYKQSHNMNMKYHSID